MNTNNRFSLILLLLVCLSFPLHSAEKEVNIDIQNVNGGIYMLKGRGGNIGISVGKDGIFMIDDQFAPLSPKIKSAIKTVSSSPIKFVINTHWHGDHVGGNQNFAKDDAIIVAQKNVRKRMSSEQFIKLFDKKVLPSAESALPIITFSDEIEFHFNGETAQVIHMPYAHTDGDAIIWFKNSNVVHMGDLYFARTFPFIDTSSGGSIDGVIKAINWVLEKANKSTRIIPGHGPLSTMEDLLAYRNMLVEARAKVKEAIIGRGDLERIKTENVLKDLVEKWGNGFIKQDAFVEIIFDSLN